VLRILDLFCGAGGAAMGYHRAGFEVVGVDHKPQPRYPFEFVQADALGYLYALTWLELLQFAAIHASPPCQAFSSARSLWDSRLGDDRHPDLIGPTREALTATGLPFVIENVERAPLLDPVTICGLSLGLGVRRHRIFETSFPVMVPPCHSKHAGDWISVFGGGALSRTPKDGQKRVDGKHNGKGAYDGRTHIKHEAAKVAMGIDWMGRDEMSDAIPPAYTELIGAQLMAQLGAARVSAR
jgi:DNA (cytosine-5)-methyltransferase 1